MKERLIVSIILIPIFFTILLFLPPFVLTIFIALVCAISAYELQRAIGVKGHDRITIYTIFAAVLIPCGVHFDQDELAFRAVMLVLLSLVFAEAIPVFKMKRQITYAHIMTTAFGGVLIPYMLASLISLKKMEYGHIYVMLPVFSSFLTDAGAYFVGVFLGKHRAFPLISPKKTKEGYIGGFLIGTAGMMMYGLIIYFTTLLNVHFGILLIYGVVGAIITELGDLAFSMIKREFDIKDYGKLLPGHGGMLDRVDSMMFAASAMYVLVTVLPAITV